MAQYFDDLASVYREELEDLGRLGCMFVQLDEVPLAMMEDAGVNEKIRSLGEDPDQLIDVYVQAIADSVRDKPADFYLDNASTAFMRYTIRRIRRKLPGAIMVLGCWTAADPAHLQEIVKADEVVNTLGAALACAIGAGKNNAVRPGGEPGLKLISKKTEESAA